MYRVALWFPDFVTHLFSICTPFWAPSKDFVPLEEMVGSRIPNFRYQLQLSSGEIEKEIQSKQQIRQVLNAFYGGQGPNGELGFDVKHGIHLKSLHTLSPTKLLKQDVRSPPIGEITTLVTSNAGTRLLRKSIRQ